MKSTFEDELVCMIPRLKNFAFRLTRNIENSEDLLSETILQSLKNKAKYKDDTNFKGWINTIMKNCFVNNYRRSVRHGIQLELEDVKGNNICTSREIDNKVYLNQILDFINNQDKKLSIPMILFSQGFKYEEISEILGIPLGTVKSRIFIMREKLTKIL